MISEQNHGSDFLRFEVATVLTPNGRWQPFITRVSRFGKPIPVPDPEDPFSLPSWPTREAAEDFSALFVWTLLDQIKVIEPGNAERVWRDVGVLE